ncbi:MAG: response regulator [Candidatus Kapabacteria bacterium]|nr:response regulator [Candidatus Kapabacteria bacterium]
MPKHSGIKFYRDIKKGKEWSKIPVLIVTGHSKNDLGKADFKALIMQGLGVYLEKPVKPNNYVATICQMLGIESPVEIQEENELDPDKLRDELLKNLSTADTEALQKALDALKKS